MQKRKEPEEDGEGGVEGAHLGTGIGVEPGLIREGGVCLILFEILRFIGNSQ